MNRPVALFLSVLALISTLFVLSTAPSAAVESATAQDAEFIDAINQLRATKGAAPLIVIDSLSSASRDHSVSMADAGTIFHASDITVGAPPGWQRASENVGVGGSVAQLMAAFVDSPGHYANLINPSFTHIGVGTVREGYRIFTTHRFIQLPVAAPVAEKPAQTQGAPAQSLPTGARTTLFVSNSLTTGVADKTFEFGVAGHQVLQGDWNGDGKTTFLFRNGNRYRGSNSLSGDLTTLDFRFGGADDEVVAADFNGDGLTTLAIRTRNEFSVSNTLGQPADDLSFSYGVGGDEMYWGDWDGDGVDTIVVRRGNVFFVKDSLTSGIADRVFAYGRNADEIVIGDWNNDGRDSIAVRRANRFFISNQLVTGVAEFEFSYGRPDDDVLVGDYDGDGVQTITVRR